jgi:hypothetical protein
MPLDVRTSQTEIENAIRDAILLALGARLPAVASVAALRAVRTRGDSSTMRNPDDLIPIVVSSVVTALYRWSPTSTAADDGAATIKPTDVNANGRWLRQTTPLRIAFSKTADSQYLHEIATGPIKQVLLFDKKMTDEEMLAVLTGQMPAVIIDAHGDSPVDATENTGHRWYTEFDFDIHVITEQLRDRREAAQGSAVSGETQPGANTIDGWIKALLGGTQMHGVLDGIRNIKLGPGSNSTSELGQRRIVRSRSISVLATEQHPNAPNDTGPAEEVDIQREMAAPDENDVADPANYLVTGIDLSEGAGLVKPIAAGSAVVAGVTVNYAGQLYTFTATRDTYRDLLPNGTLTFVAVDIEQAEPAVTATALRIGVTRTDGSGVVSDRIIAARRAPYGNPIQTPLT